MKKYIFATLALAAAAMAPAQTVTTLQVEENDGTVTSFPVSNVEGVIFQPMPEYHDAYYKLRASYQEADGLGGYFIEFGTDEPDANGDPSKIGGMQVALALTAEKTPNLLTPVLPGGYYRRGNGTQPLTFNVSKSAVYTRIEAGADGVAPAVVIDGTVDVRHEGLVYDIRMELITMSGPVDFRYVGPLEFDQGIGESTEFTEDVDVTYDGGQGRFYSNWFYPFASDIRMQFYKGEFEENVFKSGYWLTLDLNMPKVADPMNPTQRVADGTYQVQWNETVINSQYLPFTFNRGAETDFMGTIYITGSNLVYTSPEGQRKEALLVGGNLVVSNNGSQFDFDLVASNGIHVRGSYTGSPLIQNLCDNDGADVPQRPFSTLEENHVLNWNPETMAFTFYDETDQILPDLKNVLFYVATPDFDKGDYLNFMVFSETEALQDGTYEVSDEFAPFKLVPGTIGHARTPVYSWYGDLDSTDEEGYQSVLAAISEGTVVISTETDGKRLIKFNLKDDRGNAITGEFSADAIYNLNDMMDAAPKRLRKK